MNQESCWHVDLSGDLFTSPPPTAHLGGAIQVSATLEEARTVSATQCLINIESAGNATRYNFSGRLTTAGLGSSNEHRLTAELTANGVRVGEVVELSEVGPTPIERYDFTFPAFADSTLPDGTYAMVLSFVRTNSRNPPLTVQFPFQLQVNRSPPDAPEPPDLFATSDSGRSDIDNITNANALAFEVEFEQALIPSLETAELMRQQLQGDGNPIGEPTVVATTSALEERTTLVDRAAPEGDFRYSVRVRDTSGNRNVSSGLQVTVDRTGPDALADFQLSFESDTLQPGAGFSPTAIDGITFDTTPTFSFVGVTDLTLEDLEIFDGAAEIPATQLALGSTEDSGDRNALSINRELADGSHSILARRFDVAGNASDDVTAAITIETTIGDATISAPGTPVHTTLYDLGDALGESASSQPWQITFDRTTQTAWITAENGMANGTPSLGQFDPSTGTLTRFDLSVLGERADNAHGTFFDFNKHLTPRVWTAHRALGSPSTVLSFLDIGFDPEDPTRSELVSYDFDGINVPTDGDARTASGDPILEEPIRDLHAVFVDDAGTVWATSLLGDRIIELRSGHPTEDGRFDLASRDATVFVHNVPSELVTGIPSSSGDRVQESFNAHALEVFVDDSTGERYVWMVAGEGGGRTALLRTTETVLLRSAPAGSREILVGSRIETGTRLHLNAGGANAQPGLTVSSVVEQQAGFLLTLDQPLAEDHFVNESVRGPDRWLTWDFGDIDVTGTGVNLEEVRGTFTKVDNNETPGEPFDDRVIVTMPVGLQAGAASPTSGIVHVLDPGNSLRDESAPASLETYLIPRIDEAPTTHQFAAPNQPFLDRSGEVVFIDRIGSIGRFQPDELGPTLSGDVTSISTITQTAELPAPLLISPSRIVPVDVGRSPTPLAVSTSSAGPVSGVVQDDSKVDGLDQYPLSRVTDGNLPTRGAGPFRGFLNAANTLYGSLSDVGANDKLSVTVFAEAARRQMAVVTGSAPANGALVQARMAFQVVRNGSLIMTARGDGQIGDDQINLLAQLIDAGKADASLHRIFGDAAAVKDANGDVHVMGRSPLGGVVQYTFAPPKPDDPAAPIQWNQEDLSDPRFWSVTRRTDGFENHILAEDVVAAGELGFSVTTAAGDWLVIPIDPSATPVNATMEAEGNSRGVDARVYSSVGTTQLGDITFAYGSNQTGSVIEYRIERGDVGAASVRVIDPMGADEGERRDNRIMRNVRAMTIGTTRHLFATDGVSRLVHWEVDDTAVRQENVSNLTTDPDSNFGYYGFQQPFAGRVYTYVAPLIARDGTIRVYGTNGGNLVEFTRSPDGSWRVGNLTQDTNSTFGADRPRPRVPANAVFGAPAAYTDSNGGRHVLQINVEGEVVEYFTYGDLFGGDSDSANRINSQNVNFFSDKSIEALVGEVDGELVFAPVEGAPSSSTVRVNSEVSEPEEGQASETDATDVLVTDESANGQAPTGSEMTNEAPASSLESEFLPQDVNRDRRVTPNDAVLVINRIARANQAGETFSRVSTDNADYGYDVNGDGRVNPRDALMVINHIARSSAFAEAESLDDVVRRQLLDAADELAGNPRRQRTVVIQCFRPLGGSPLGVSDNEFERLAIVRLWRHRDTFGHREDSVFR